MNAQDTETVGLLCESAGKMLNMRDVKPYYPDAVLAAATGGKKWSIGFGNSANMGTSKYRLVCIKSVLDSKEPTADEHEYRSHSILSPHEPLASARENLVKRQGRCTPPVPFTLNYKPTPGGLKHSGTSVPRHSEAQPEGWAYNRVSTVQCRGRFTSPCQCLDTGLETQCLRYRITTKTGFGELGSESSGEWEDITDDEEPLISQEEAPKHRDTITEIEPGTDAESQLNESHSYKTVANLHELSSSPVGSVDNDELEAFLNQDECMSDTGSLHEDTFLEHGTISKAEVDKFVKSIRPVTVDDDIAGCFSIQGMVEKQAGALNKTGWRTVKQTGTKQYEQTLFCKMSPLIEPLKVINDTIYPDYMELSEYRLPGDTARQVVEKINSVNNSSHVEALAMYMNSRLTEQGKCPAFPYFYGCINGISKTYYHDITDEISMYTDQQWFVDKVNSGKIDLCTVNLDELGDDIKANPKYDLSAGSPANNMLKRCVDADSGELQSRLLGINRLSELGDGLDEELNDLDLNSGIEDMQNIEASELPVDLHLNNQRLNAHILDADADIDDLDLAGLKQSNVYDNKIFYMKMTDYPVSYCFMEKMGTTLDALMHGPEPLEETEWLSVLFQVAFGLAAAGKSHQFVHNDLHCANIMFQSTAENYLYYYINGHYYRIPTFRRIAKIIDFARATFKVNDRWIFSDVFLLGGDAAEQYTYPDVDGKIKKTRDTVMPNPSFDLVLLSTSIFNDIDDKHMALKSMIYSWCQSSEAYADNMLERPVDFQLYIDIARECKNAKPKEVLKAALFQRFRIKKAKIPAGKFVYVY